MVHHILSHNFSDGSGNALLCVAVAVGQTEQLNSFVGINQAAQGNVINGHLVSGVPVDVRRELHLEAWGGILTNVLRYLDVLAKELVDRPVLLHYFQDAVDEGNILARTLQVPHKLVKGLDSGLLLPALPKSILNEITHHLEILKSSAPVLAWELRGIWVDESTFLPNQCRLDVVPEPHRIAEWEVEEDDVSGGIEILTRFHFDRDRALVLGLLGHLEKGFSKECHGIAGALEVEGRSEGPLSLVLDGVEEHLDILFPESLFVIKVRKVPGQVAHLFYL